MLHDAVARRPEPVHANQLVESVVGERLALALNLYRLEGKSLWPMVSEDASPEDEEAHPEDEEEGDEGSEAANGSDDAEPGDEETDEGDTPAAGDDRFREQEIERLRSLGYIQ